MDTVHKIQGELNLIAWARDQHNTGEMPDHSFDEQIHDHLDNIIYAVTDLNLSLDRAMAGANKQEDALTTVLEDLRSMWWRVKKLSA